MVPSPDSLGFIFFQLAAEGRRTAVCIAAAYHSSQLQLLQVAINMHQRFLTIFFFFFSQKQMNILSISSKTQGKWIYESWVIGIPRVRGGVIKFLVFLPFNFQLSLHLERGTHHAY